MIAAYAILWLKVTSHINSREIKKSFIFLIFAGTEPDSALIKKIKTQWRRIELRNFYSQMREKERLDSSDCRKESILYAHNHTCDQ